MSNQDTPMTPTGYVDARGRPMEPPPLDSPLWWLLVLENRLIQRQGKMERFDAYYTGDHPLPFLTKAHQDKAKDEFRELLNDSRSNFMRLVVDATEERLSVEGFRLSAEKDMVADPDSWEIWQANQMDAQIGTGFLESLIKGMSYLSVWADDDEDGYADIRVEDPMQTIVGYVPGSNYTQRRCALKIWLDDLNGVRRANVYLPDAIYKFSAPANWVPIQTPTPADQVQVPWDALPDPEFEVANPIGIVPIIPLRNRPRLLIEGESELADVFRIQNQINGFLFLLAMAGYFGAHKQRWALGVALTEDRNEPFFSATDRLWVDDNIDAKFGEFTPTDLAPYITAIEQKVRHIAVTTRTPRHYLEQTGQSPSGDAIQSAESGLVKKVERKQRTFGDGIEEAIILARRFQGEGDVPPDSEVVWGNAASPTPGLITDSVIKQWAARLIPMSTALQQLGYTQTQIRQIVDTFTNDNGQFAAEKQQAVPPAASGDNPVPTQDTNTTAQAPEPTQ